MFNHLFPWAWVLTGAFAFSPSIACASGSYDASLSARGRNTAQHSLSAGRGWQQMMKQTPAGKLRQVSPQTSRQASFFNFLEGPDGTTWYFTQDIQYRDPEETGYTYTFASSSFCIYNSKHELQGQFTIEVPQDMVINAIEPYGTITKKLFDLNASTLELTVSLHEITPDYVGREHVWIYQLDGKKLQEFEGIGMVVDASANDWTTYQRFVLSHNNADDPRTTDIDFYRPASWGEEGVQLEHTLSVDGFLINYMDAPFLNFFNDGGTPYYVLSHYEKSFDERDEEGNMIIDPETYMPSFTDDNNFIITTFDRNFKEVSRFVIPTEAPEGAAIRMMGIGALSDFDISRGKFTQDNQLNYIVMYEDATLQFETVLSYNVFNQQGDHVALLAANVGDFWNVLSPIRGAEEQMIFMTVDNQLFTVDIPSMNVTQVPTTIDERIGSVNIDRYACADDPKGYRYVMPLNEALTDASQMNVISRFVHLSSSFVPVRNVDINLGPLAMTFNPLVNEQSLNPYLFNTDDMREYIFLSKIKDSYESEQLHNTLFIANDKGEIVESFNLEGGDADGDILSVSLLNYGTPASQLFICYYNWDADLCTLRYFDLPFTRFTAGGDGSKESPYLISSVGDLQQMACNTAAHYRLACDFDAYGHPVALEEFSGVIDGAGHTISHLDVTSDHYYGGLLGAAVGATVGNIKFLNPRADILPGNENFGLLSGYATSCQFSDIVVSGLEVSGMAASTPVGGLVGCAMAGSTLSTCLLVDAHMQAHNTLGGIVGEMRTGSSVSASAVLSSLIEGNSEVGGIIGGLGMGSSVHDCFVSETTISGLNRLGGIAGYSNGTKIDDNGGHGCLSHNIVSQCIVEETGDQHRGLAAVVGHVEPQWTTKDTVVSQNVVIDSYVVLPAEGLAAEQMRSIHAIAGYSKDNEEPDRPGQVLKEEGLCDNFVHVSDEAMVDASTYYGGGDDAASTEGKRISAEELAPQNFWTTLGYAFGETPDAPWVFTEGQAPLLYIISDDNIPSSLPAITSRQGAAPASTSYNLLGQPAAPEAKGWQIVGGRRIIHIR